MEPDGDANPRVWSEGMGVYHLAEAKQVQVWLGPGWEPHVHHLGDHGG